LAYPLLRLPALECLTSLANCVVLLCPLLTSAPRSGRLAAPSVPNLEQRRRPPQVSPIAFPAPCRIYRLGLWWIWTLRLVARSSGQECLLSGFCPSGRGFAPHFLQTPPRGGRPCASL